MPELPEVEALAAFLRERAVARVVARVDVGAISVLKTYDPSPTALHGLAVTSVARHGKFLDLDVDGVHLVFHLARAGWLRWSDNLRASPVKPGRGPLALRVRLDDPDVEGSPGFDRDALAAILVGARQQVKGLLRDQSVLAGVGNVYSDEVLHAAKLSPFAIAATLDDAQVDRLYAALHEVLTEAVAVASGKPAKELKDAKRAGMRVHGRAGQLCPVCGDTVREVSFADCALQYCPTCQTGGKPLADRRLSRLLK